MGAIQGQINLGDEIEPEYTVPWSWMDVEMGETLSAAVSVSSGLCHTSFFFQGWGISMSQKRRLILVDVMGISAEVQMEGRSFTAFPSKKANDTEIGSLEVKIGLKHQGVRGSHYDCSCIPQKWMLWKMYFSQIFS